MHNKYKCSFSHMLIIIIHFPTHSLEEMDSIPQKNFPIFILVNNDKKALKKAITTSKGE